MIRWRIPKLKVEVATGLAALLLCLATYGGRLQSVDEVAVYSLAYNLVQRGALDVDVLLSTLPGMREPPFTGVGAIGPDGHFYSGKGILPSWLAIPLVKLALFLPAGDPVAAALWLNALLTAFTAAIITRHLRQRGSSAGASFLAGLIYVAGTMAWPYAKRLFTEPAAGLCVVLTYHWLTAHRHALWVRLVFAGFAFGGAVAASYSNAVLLPCFIVLMAVEARPPRWRNFAASACVFGLAVSPWLFGLGWYNGLRFGDATRTGLALTEWSAPYFTVQAALVRVYGLLLSPYRGLLWYNPVLLLAVPAFAVALKTRSRDRLLALATAAGGTVCYLLLFSYWSMWWGGYNWGPRFLLPVLPIWAIAIAPAFEALLSRTVGWAWRAAIAAVALISIGVSLVGALSDTFAAEGVVAKQGLLSALVRPESVAASPLLTDPAYFQAVDGVQQIASGRLETWWAGMPDPLDEALRQSLRDIAERATPASAVVLAAPNRLESFLHAFRLPLRVIGLSPDQIGADEAQDEGDVHRLLGHARLFLLTDAGQADSGNTTERWLERNAFRARNEFYPPWRTAAFGATEDGMVVESLNTRFGDRVRLREVWHTARVAPGGAIALTALWERLKPGDPVGDLAWYAHLIAPDGQLIAQHDALIGGGYGWGEAEERSDRRGILVPQDADPGVYRVRIGVYAPDGPLAAATPDSQVLPDDAVSFEVAVGPAQRER